MATITGHKAIEMATEQGLTLHKYADPTEGARSGLTLAEARVVAAVDPSLVYITVGKARSGSRFAEFKNKAAGCAVYQRGPNDVSGWEQDAEWRAALRRVRSWARAAEVLPWRHPLAATAANGGED